MYVRKPRSLGQSDPYGDPYNDPNSNVDQFPVDQYPEDQYYPSDSGLSSASGGAFTATTGLAVSVTPTTTGPYQNSDGSTTYPNGMTVKTNNTVVNAQGVVLGTLQANGNIVNSAGQIVGTIKNGVAIAAVATASTGIPWLWVAIGAGVIFYVIKK